MIGETHQATLSTAPRIWAFGMLPDSNARFVDPAQVEIAREWIQRFTRPVAEINRRTSSYRMKHLTEAWARSERLVPSYVSNGAFITAALLEGYTVQWTEGRPNCVFNFAIQRGAFEVSR
jgi:hypothetical protein